MWPLGVTAGGVTVQDCLVSPLVSRVAWCGVAPLVQGGSSFGCALFCNCAWVGGVLGLGFIGSALWLVTLLAGHMQVH